MILLLVITIYVVNFCIMNSDDPSSLCVVIFRSVTITTP